MGEEIYHLPCDIWKYYQDHIEELKEEVEVIAANPNIATYIDIAVGDDDVLTVEAWDSDDLIEFVQLEDEEQCEFIISELYKMYITGEDDTSLGEDYMINNRAHCALLITTYLNKSHATATLRLGFAFSLIDDSYT